MKQLAARLTALGKRVDALSLRERVMVLVASLVVAGGLAQLLLFDPLLAREKAARGTIAQARTDLEGLAARFRELEKARAVDPDAPHRVRLGEMRKRQGEVETYLEQVRGSLVPPERMSALLRDVLKGQRRVGLVGLRNLPAAPLVAPAAEGAQKVAAGDRPAPPAQEKGQRQLYRHGVELTLEGPYLELLDYVSALEALPWRMYWSASQLDAKDYPRVTLKLTLFTLSLEQSWLAL